MTRETKRGLELAADFGLDKSSEEDREGEDAGDDDPDVDFGDSKRSLVFHAVGLVYRSGPGLTSIERFHRIPTSRPIRRICSSR